MLRKYGELPYPQKTRDKKASETYKGLKQQLRKVKRRFNSKHLQQQSKNKKVRDMAKVGITARQKHMQNKLQEGQSAKEVETIKKEEMATNHQWRRQGKRQPSGLEKSAIYKANKRKKHHSKGKNKVL